MSKIKKGDAHGSGLRGDDTINKARIVNDRLVRFLSDDIQLKKGDGNGVLPDGTLDMCVMQAVDWITGGTGTEDSPACVDAAITRFCVRLNDAPQFEEFRDELKPYAPRIANTAGDVALRRKRAFMCADWAVRKIAPMAIDAHEKRADLAQRLRDLPEVVDAETSRAARDVAQETMKELRAASAAYVASAASAVTAAYATAAADYAAYAADSAAADYARAAETASAAAYTAYAAAGSYAAGAALYAASAFRVRDIWDASLAHLTRLIEAQP